MGKIEINWKEILGPSSPDRRDVYFAASPSAAPARAAAAAAKGKGVGEFAGVTNNELRREIARSRSVHPEFEGFLRDGGKDNRRRRAALEAEARRRGLDTAAKAGDDCKRDARSAEKNVFSFDYEDEQGEYAARKYCLESSPICSTKNYGQLGINTHRSLRRGGQRKPISVDKMYSSKPCSTTLSGHQHRIHAIDPEEADNEKCRQNENNNSTYSTKRRKSEHQDSSLFCFQKVQDLVLLDDEDAQPEEPVDCGVPDKWIESKIYYPSRDDPEAVELTSSDVKCLDHGVYLSSPVINYYIQYIKMTKLHNEDCRDKFHIFNTYFYSKLREALLGKGEFSKFRRWWKGVNMFHRGYIILPIHGTAHWSLIVICNPAKESNSGPIILHLDSLGMHPSADIFHIVGRFLEAEWCHLRKNPPPDISISETIWEDLPRNIHKEKVQVPRQNNEYDCGIFMLYYIERFIREAPERFTSENLDMFSRSWFKSEDASELRQRIRELLLEEFESARLDDAMSEADTSDRSDDEYGIKCGESEAATASDSIEMIAEGGDIGIRNEDTAEVGASEEAPSSICRSDDKITDCVLSEAATFSDSVKDEEDSMKANSDSSKTEQGIAILSIDRSKNNEGIIMHRAPDPDIICDSSDSDMDDVKIIEVRNKITKWPNCWIS